MAGLCFWGDAGMACNLGYGGIVVIFFLAAVFRRQVAVTILNMNFDLVWSMIAAVPVYFVLLLFLPLKFAFLIGAVVALFGGFIGMVIPIIPTDIE